MKNEEVEDFRAVKIKKEEGEEKSKVKIKKGEGEDIDEKWVGKKVEENKTGDKINKLIKWIVFALKFIVASCIFRGHRIV